MGYEERRESLRQREIVLQEGISRVVVYPDDGGLVAKFQVGDINVLFPDTLLDRGNNLPLKRRGGNPILWPNAGSPKSSDSFNLDKHAFARDIPWTILFQDTNVVLLEARGNKKDLNYPYDWGIRREVSVSGYCLKENVEIRNESKKNAMPFVFGYHPYFNSPNEPDNSTTSNIEDLNIDKHTLDDSLSFALTPDTSIEIDGVGYIRMSVSGGFLVEGKGGLVFWRDVYPYVCFEPRAGKDIRVPNERLELGPGEKINFGLEIELII